MMPNQMRYYGSLCLARVLTLQSRLIRDLTWNCLAKRIDIDKAPSNSIKDLL
jgi:hypothetical protein